MNQIRIEVKVFADDEQVFNATYEGFGAFEAMQEKAYKVENVIKKMAKLEAEEQEENYESDHDCKLDENGEGSCDNPIHEIIE